MTSRYTSANAHAACLPRSRRARCERSACMPNIQVALASDQRLPVVLVQEPLCGARVAPRGAMRWAPSLAVPAASARGHAHKGMGRMQRWYKRHAAASGQAPQVDMRSLQPPPEPASAGGGCLGRRRLVLEGGGAGYNSFGPGRRFRAAAGQGSSVAPQGQGSVSLRRLLRQGVSRGLQRRTKARGNAQPRGHVAMGLATHLNLVVHAAQAQQCAAAACVWPCRHGLDTYRRGRDHTRISGDPSPGDGER